jgi:lambda family phage minor tail protein L
MSKSLSVASVIEKNRLSSDTPFLVLLDIDVVDPDSGSVVETLYFVRNTEAVTFNGHSYQPMSFDIELKEETGEGQSITLTVKDYSRLVQQRMQSYKGGVGFGVTVTIANAAALDKPAEVQEFFQVTAAEASNFSCSFTLGTDNFVTKGFPRRRQTRDYCQWRYKGEECGYTGVLASCDLTRAGPNGCEAHANVIRFGAFPGINSNGVRYG